uniref:Pre-mRNA splicing Prp18-interacting factor n=1 Tax=Tanacetum cinerariifolium TaxID=118510 RepID=A0A6L2MMF2_TANCI|nr:hypothetical protein [Tanacetum cinerariifolium]
MSSFYEFTCYGCGNPSDTPLCYLCTCEQCRNILMDGTCSKCNSGAGNSFVYDPNPKSFNEFQSIFNPPPLPHYKIYLCQLCESNFHYGYECSQRVPLVYEPEPCYNQSFGDNDYPHDSPGEIYSNPLFDEEIISIKIDPHHINAESDLIESLLNQDSLIISSSKIDSLFDEFAGELILLKSIPPRIDEADCDPEEKIYHIEKLLYDNSSPRPPEEFISENSDAAIESLSPSPIPVEDSDSFRDEIDLSLTLDDSMPPGIDDDDYEFGGDILILEDCFTMILFPFQKTSHFILIFHHPFATLRNHQMMMKLSPI